MPTELIANGLRHAFALRLELELGLSVREAAELMGHSLQVHLSTYGRRLDQPKLHSKVHQLVRKNGSKPRKILNYLYLARFWRSI